MQEDSLLVQLRELFATPDSSVLLGSGPDDCALVESDGRRISISTDAFVEGSHFLPDADPRDIARKALAASLSDLAASACHARWVLVSLCLKTGIGSDWAPTFAGELAKVARDYGVTIIGGDTVASGCGTFISITVVGEPLPGGPLLRSGGRPGDALVVTGVLGGSICGKHFRPVPRLREIRLLMRFLSGTGRPELLPGAGMDISDGLGLDLSRLCRESNTGAVIEADRIPISEAAHELAAKSGCSPIHHALTDGEDFELLLSIPQKGWEMFADFLSKNASMGDMTDIAPFTCIGVLTRGEGVAIRDTDGILHPLTPQGYEHQW